MRPTERRDARTRRCPRCSERVYKHAGEPRAETVDSCVAVLKCMCELGKVFVVDAGTGLEAGEEGGRYMLWHEQRRTLRCHPDEVRDQLAQRWLHRPVRASKDKGCCHTGQPAKGRSAKITVAPADSTEKKAAP